MRIISYPEAIRESIAHEMSVDPSVIVMGQGVDDPKAILGSLAGIKEEFGQKRIFDVPLAEDGITGIAVGAAISGLKPIHVHIRNDFVLLAMNQLVNMAAKMRYMYGGQHDVPMVIRAIIGKSWGQGPQHSQSIYSMLMNVPGLLIVAPTSPHDVKGIMTSSIRSKDPVLFIEHRHLYYQKGEVPENSYTMPIGKGRILQEGNDGTIVGISQMAIEALRAGRLLAQKSISAEVIDPISLNPLDMDLIAASVGKTGRLIVVDNGWMTCGVGAEIFMQLYERQCATFKFARMGYAKTTCPTTPSLEDHFYPNASTIARKAYEFFDPQDAWQPVVSDRVEEVEFKGPF